MFVTLGYFKNFIFHKIVYISGFYVKKIIRYKKIILLARNYVGKEKKMVSELH